MKRLIIITLFFISVFVVCGAAQCDSLNVLSGIDKATVIPAHNNHAASAESSVDGFDVPADFTARTYNTPDSSYIDYQSANNSESTDYSHLFENSDSTVSLRPVHRLAVKTNLLYDAALLPNIEVDWRLDARWSLSLEGGVAWWGKYSREKSYRLAMVSPELKRWIRPRGPWHGFYIGVFAGCGLYDLEKNTRGYRGEGVMGGLSAGFMWPVSRCLSLEAALGGGYLFTRYKEYVPIHGHHVYQRTKEINYFGPLKVKFSLVWRLWDTEKSRRHAGKNVARYGK